MKMVLEAVGEGTKMADQFSPKVRPAFPSSVIISERSSPSRVRCAAPNNGAPLTACGPFQNNTLRRGKGSLQTGRLVGDHFAAILVPFFSATDTRIQCGQNIYDQAAAPLKPGLSGRRGYPDYKAARGLQSVRDGTRNGHTLRCLKVLTANENRAEPRVTARLFDAAIPSKSTN